MKLEQVKAFMAVAEAGSFRSAAEILHKTQPTISASIRGLEDSFNTLLFDRKSYRPTLTPEGKTLYEQAQQLISAAQDFESLGFSLSEGVKENLSISLSATCAQPPRLDRFREFFDSFGHVELQISTEHHSGILERLNSSQSDLAIGPNIMLNNQYEYIEIGEIQMVTVAAPGYFSDQNNESIPQKIARERPHILVSDTGTKAPTDPLNTLTGGKKWFVRDYQVKKELLLAGMGWARIPMYLVSHAIKEGRLSQIQIERFNNTSRIPIYIIRLKDRTLSRVAAAFWETMTE